jgi:hypothetical protein
MSEPVTNGNGFPPAPYAHVVDTAVVEHLDLKELMYERGSTGLYRSLG